MNTRKVIKVPFVTPFKSQTLTVSAGFGTVTLSSLFTRRVGDTMHGYGIFRTGTVAASLTSITVPLGLSINTSKVTTESQAQVFGIANSVPAGAANQVFGDNRGLVLFYDGIDPTLLFVTPSGSSNVFEKQNGNSYFGNGENVSFSFSIPISGWNTHQIIRI